MKHFSKILFAFLIISIVSCSVRKKTAPITTTEKEISILCSDPSVARSDKNFFRGNASAASPELSFSKTKALLQAKTIVAGLIEATIKNVVVAYANERSISTTKEFEAKVEQMAKEISNQTLTHVNITCEKATKSADGYTTYIAIEVPVQMEGMETNFKRIGSEQKLQLDYDRMKFKEEFEKEMDKLANDQGGK